MGVLVGAPWFACMSLVGTSRLLGSRSLSAFGPIIPRSSIVMPSRRKPSVFQSGFAMREGSVAVKPKIEKPESHSQREYEYIRLDNGLQVILSSEPSCDKAAAALVVGVGKLHEPKELPGLAHFCEHMLFLGTERFPEEGEYRSFLKRHGGSCNGGTGDASTSYFFDVAPGHLASALDRFSQFFISPLFTRSGTDREINAVDSEHSMRLTDDGRRSLATLLVDANPAHPWHWGSGNASSLRDDPLARGIDIHSSVLKFYRDSYSARDMTLAVLGPESLDELRDMVKLRFADVPDTGQRALRGDAHGGDEPAILPQDFHALILRAPSKDQRILTFSWQLPEWQIPMWASKPSLYSTFLLGSQVNGSLQSILKARGLASGVSASTPNHGCFSHFKIGIALTKEGLYKVEEIGRFVFQYLHILRNTAVEQWRLEEIRTLTDISFRFADQVQPSTLVKALAKNLQHHPPEYVLSGPRRLLELDAEATQSILSLLSVEDVRVELIAKDFAGQCTERDPYYHGHYAKLSFPDSWRKAWSEVGNSNLADQLEHSGMSLPDTNPFLPDDLSLRPLSSEQGLWPADISQAIDHASVLKTFYRQDDKFMQPKATLSFLLQSAEIAKDSASFLRAQIWCSAVNEQLESETFNADVAGLGYSLQASLYGIVLSVSGFNDKMPVLLRALLRKMHSMTALSENTFTILHDRYERGLKNLAFKQRPVGQASQRSLDLQAKLNFPLEETLESLRYLKREDLDGESARLLGSAKVESLMIGNLASEEAQAALDTVVQELRLSNSRSVELPVRAYARLPRGHTLWKLNGTDSNDVNHCVRREVQIPHTFENNVYLSLLVRLLSSRFFDQIRTQQQLGYITRLTSSANDAFLSLVCTVQTEHPPDYVRGRIDDFLEDNLQWVEQELDEKDFIRACDGLASNLAEKPKNLQQESSRYWGEITMRRYDFGRRARKEAAVKAASLESMRAFVRQVREASQLSIEVHSTRSGPTAERPVTLGAKDTDRRSDPVDRTWEGPDAARTFRASAEWFQRDDEVHEETRC